jgi:hypothetical protein
MPEPGGQATGLVVGTKVLRGLLKEKGKAGTKPIN